MYMYMYMYIANFRDSCNRLCILPLAASAQRAPTESESDSVLAESHDGLVAKSAAANTGAAAYNDW